MVLNILVLSVHRDVGGPLTRQYHPNEGYLDMLPFLAIARETVRCGHGLFTFWHAISVYKGAEARPAEACLLTSVETV